jgi:hypothetical protein
MNDKQIFWYCVMVVLIIIVIMLVIYNIKIYNNNKIYNNEYFFGSFKPRLSINTNFRPSIYNPGHENAIVTLYTDNIKDYADYTIKNFKKYCLDYNISLYIFDKSLSNEITHGCWNKIVAILYMLNNTKHKYIIWMDVDAVFNRMDIKFDKFINKYKQKDMIVCRDIRDAKYKFNSGVMILKNNEWTKKIFQDTWNDNTPHGYGGNGDQVIIRKKIVEDGKANDNFDENSGNKHVALLSEREFNSFPRDIKHENLGSYTDNDFIIHFMGHNTKERIKYISSINNKFNIV